MKKRFGFIEFELTCRDANDPTRQAWAELALAKDNLRAEVIEAIRPLIEPTLNWLVHFLIHGQSNYGQKGYDEASND